jgi:hypothetical protein
MQPTSAGAVTQGFFPLLEATDDNRFRGSKAQTFDAPYRLE